MAYILKVDGSTETLPDTNLETLQRAVGGYIQEVKLWGAFKMIVNEEGKLHDLPLNPKASALALPVLGDVIVGDVVIAKNNELQ